MENTPYVGFDAEKIKLTRIFESKDFKRDFVDWVCNC